MDSRPRAALPDTPDDSPDSDQGGADAVRSHSRRSLPGTETDMPYPSPPPSPLYPMAPQEEGASTSVAPGGTAQSMGTQLLKPLPPTSLMQGYVSPPATPTTRTTFPPAEPSRAQPNALLAQGDLPARHFSAPLPHKVPVNINIEPQNDVFGASLTAPVPIRQKRREAADADLLLPSQRSPLRPKRMPDATQQQQVGLPPLPMGADVCVECMMRDRDMAEVDVLSPGVWDRASDVDFYDLLRTEEADSVRRRESTASSRMNGAASGSDGEHGGSRWSLGQPAASSSRESASYEQSVRHRVRRIGRGHELTEASLKLWTSMKPAASSHRWRTLQMYLREQNRLIAMEQASQKANEMERTKFEEALRGRSNRDLVGLRKSFASGRNRSSTVLPSGITVERVDVEKEERALRKVRTREHSRERRDGSLMWERPHSESNYPYLSASPAAGMSSTSLFAIARQDSSPERPLSSPLLDTASRRSFPLYAQSTSDLRSTSSRAGRPSSLAPSERPSSTLFQGPRSASTSVYSFAPSGSMIDMHIGLEQDRHLSLGQEGIDAFRQLSDDEVIQASTRKKSKTMSKFFSKLHLRSAPSSPPRHGTMSPRGSASLLATSPVDEEPLEPPFPSYLAGDLASHRRSPTVSTSASMSSLPVTPELDSAIVGLSIQSQMPMRREKSLPAIPMEDEQIYAGFPAMRPSLTPADRATSAPEPGQIALKKSNASALTPTPESDSTEHIGGGRKAKASRIPPRLFGLAGWRKRNIDTPLPNAEDTLFTEKSRHFDDTPVNNGATAVVRDMTFVATRYPSLT